MGGGRWWRFPTAGRVRGRQLVRVGVVPSRPTFHGPARSHGELRRAEGSKQARVAASEAGDWLELVETEPLSAPGSGGSLWGRTDGGRQWAGRQALGVALAGAGDASSMELAGRGGGWRGRGLRGVSVGHETVVAGR